MAIIGLRAFARKVGCAVSSVQKAMDGGRLTPTIVIVDGQRKLDEMPALLAWNSTKDEPSDDDEDDEGGDGDGNELYQARVRKERAMADLRELEYSTKRGDLVEKAAVKRVFFEWSRQARDVVSNIPSRLGAVQAAALLVFVKDAMGEILTDEQVARLADVLDPKAIEAVVNDTMTEELRAILEGLADTEAPAMIL